jgi:hypothetical protein
MLVPLPKAVLLRRGPFTERRAAARIGAAAPDWALLQI